MSAVSIKRLRKTMNDYISAQARRDEEKDLREAIRDAEREKREAKLAVEREKRVVEILAKIAAEGNERIEKQNERINKQWEERDARYAKQWEERDARFEKQVEKQREENEKSKKENDEGFKRLRQQLGSLGISYGEQTEAMFVNLGDKFNVLGYDFPKEAKGGVEFRDENRRVLAEVDHLLENGSVVMPVEIKSKLKIDDVKDHIKRLEKIKEYNSIYNDNRKVLGAIGGGVVPKNVREYAIKKGLYVLVQSGESVEIAEIPMSFKPRVW